MNYHFVHAADLHLDTPFDGIGRAEPRIAAALREASLAAFDALVQLTLDRHAAFLLLAGDLYDGPARGVRARIRLRAGLERLAAAGIRTFVALGNHDPADSWPPGSFPPGVHVFGDAPGAVPVHAPGAGEDTPVLATIHGISHPTAGVTADLAARLTPAADAAGLRIGLVHCDVGSSVHAPYAPTTLATLRAAGQHYWALGHVHARAVVGEDPWIVYPGNLQGRSPKPTETGAKGAVIVAVEGARVTGVEFVALDGVRFLEAEATITGLAEPAALHRRLTEAAERLRAEHAGPGRGLLLRAVVTGRGPLHAELARPGTADELLAELRAPWEGTEPFLWWHGLRLGTAPELGRAALLARDDFTAALLRRVDALAGDDEAAAAFVADATHLPPAAARATPADERSAAGLLRDAEAIAAELLAGEEAAP
jgi:DNA repair protein SbcD/Mre11